ncbi:hypothetical protein PQX77_017518 [Marasmius sp. AFHP31]|nr:hypothetical protein PQX77_017518 [Marasmius sp. AFHP31]
MSAPKRKLVLDLLQANKAGGSPTKRVRVGNTVTTAFRTPSGPTLRREVVPRSPSKSPSKSFQTLPEEENASTESPQQDTCEMETSCEETTANCEEKDKHQSRSVDGLKAFEKIAGELTTWLLLHEYDPNVNCKCLCGQGKCLVQCQDCQDFDICCMECWLKRHVYNPWHWARV